MWDLTTFAEDRTLGSTDAQTGHSEPQWTRARAGAEPWTTRSLALSPSGVMHAWTTLASHLCLSEVHP